MAQRGHTLGVDFGTSNSAADILDDGKLRLIDMAPGESTLPTTVFFDFETRQTLFGDPANQALLDGTEGRFMRALKRVLGTTLMHEKRQILNERITFVDIIGRFLSGVKSRAEAETGRCFTHALSGRPVVFHAAGDPREAQAEADLRACYLAAGFEEVSFLPEPEAAAIASGSPERDGQIGLIVDIGGGTSDFSLFRVENERISILANHGVRIGGTDFDRALSIDHVMPLLGLGTRLRKAMGPGFTPTPKAIYHDLATWEMIPFLYKGQSRRMVREMTQLAEDPAKLRRLAAVLEHELGHELAFAVEGGKINANGAADGADIRLDAIEPGLSTPLTAEALTASLTRHSASLRRGARDTLDAAALPSAQVDAVIYVGGSSLMGLVAEAMHEIFPDAQHSFHDVFTAVARGLAIAAADRDANAR